MKIKMTFLKSCIVGVLMAAVFPFIIAVLRASSFTKPLTSESIGQCFFEAYFFIAIIVFLFDMLLDGKPNYNNDWLLTFKICVYGLYLLFVFADHIVKITDGGNAFLSSFTVIIAVERVMTNIKLFSSKKNSKQEPNFEKMKEDIKADIFAELNISTTSECTPKI